MAYSYRALAVAGFVLLLHLVGCVPANAQTTATLDSGERELRLIAAQDAIASPACEFAVAQVR